MDLEIVFNIGKIILLVLIVFVVLNFNKIEENIKGNIENNDDKKIRKDLKRAGMFGDISVVFFWICIIGAIILFVSAVASGDVEEMLLTMVAIPVVLSLPLGIAVFLVEGATNILNKYKVNNIEIKDKLTKKIKFYKNQFKLAIITCGASTVLLLVFALIFVSLK